MSIAKKKKTISKKIVTEVQEEKALLNKIARVSVNARRRAFSKNATVTIIRKGKIVRIDANRKQTVLGNVAKASQAIDTSKPVRIK